jgi:chemotaxis protein CheX
MSMTTAAEIRTFVEGTTNYFEISARQPASVGSPYLVTEGAPGVHEYTGIIGISGARKGMVYFTAPRAMLTVLLMRMNETDTSDDNIKDLVGEVANTISGNARKDFGKEFVISTPMVVAHDPKLVNPPTHVRPFVIPINWRTHSAKLVVCLE